VVLVLGETLRRTAVASLFFPPVFLIAGALPPLAVLAWTIHEANSELTWRRFSVAFIVGATISVGLAIALEILLSAAFLVLVEGLFEIVRGTWQELVEALAGGETARALSSYGYIFAMLELALIAPLAEEFAKPLITIPLLNNTSSPRGAFWIGAAAGAGFAALENLLYTGFGVQLWGGVFVLRAVGAAIHPLCSGLVALGWYLSLKGSGDHVSGNQGTGRGSVGVEGWTYRWIGLFGAAVGIHALWNGGSVTLATLVGAQFFGENPPEVEVLGLTIVGVLLALLVALGTAAWVGMRAFAQNLPEKGMAEPEGTTPSHPLSPIFLASDRAIAIWAAICLIVALPLGLAALVLLRGTL
jgi:RsiW-degrading membrane proteinase PrsW (M82 family)